MYTSRMLKIEKKPKKKNPEKQKVNRKTIYGKIK